MKSSLYHFTDNLIRKRDIKLWSTEHLKSCKFSVDSYFQIIFRSENQFIMIFQSGPICCFSCTNLPVSHLDSPHSDGTRWHSHWLLPSWLQNPCCSSDSPSSCAARIYSEPWHRPWSCLLADSSDSFPYCSVCPREVRILFPSVSLLSGTPTSWPTWASASRDRRALRAVPEPVRGCTDGPCGGPERPWSVRRADPSSSATPCSRRGRRRARPRSTWGALGHGHAGIPVIRSSAQRSGRSVSACRPWLKHEMIDFWLFDWAFSKNFLKFLKKKLTLCEKIRGSWCCDRRHVTRCLQMILSVSGRRSRRSVLSGCGWNGRDYCRSCRDGTRSGCGGGPNRRDCRQLCRWDYHWNIGLIKSDNHLVNSQFPLSFRW